MPNLYKRALINFIPILLALGAGFLIGSRWDARSINTDVLAVRENSGSRYRYIQPLLTFETPESSDIGAYKLLKKQLEKMVEDKISNGVVKKISIYFRGLARGNWIAINADEKYTPASLLKVPTMVAFYKLAESNPAILYNTAVYHGLNDANNGSYYAPAKSIEPEKSYTIEDLIHYMIIYSDNNATRLLHQNIREELLQKVYTDLGLDTPENASAVDFMNVVQYSYFFRVLYNATYLNRAYSEKALQLLSEPDFPQGIKAGVPADIKVAQKFGERTIYSPDGTADSRELHDCGIVYYPAHPYLLCVMTKGNNFDTMASTIKEVSKITYLARKKQF